VQAAPQGQTFTVEIVIYRPPGQTPQQNTSQRKPAMPTPLSLLKPRQELPTGGPTHPRRRGSAQPVRTILRTKPCAPQRADCRNQNCATTGPARYPNIRRKVNARRDLVAPLIPNSRWNASQNPNDLNPIVGGRRHRRRNPNCQQPNSDKTKGTMQAVEVKGI